MSGISWVTAFVDVPAEHHGATSGFWASVTGYAVSPPRGEHGEFTTLLPPDGDPFVKVQRTAPPGGIHVDLHVDSTGTAADRAGSLGAEIVHRSPHGYVVMRSPGGFTFCFVHETLSTRPAPTRWPSGHESIVDQVCLDIPPAVHDGECAFWSGLTGWPVRPSVDRPEFHHLARPDGMPIRVLLQRLDDDRDGVVTGHLDLAADVRADEVRRHEHLGAVRVAEPPGGGWTVLRDPAGSTYCITDRNPRSGFYPSPRG